MTISPLYAAALLAVAALCTLLTRALPFLLFGRRSLSPTVARLGRALPCAVMAILIVYCYRASAFDTFAAWVPQLVAGALVVALHLWKHNTLLSIAGGTVCYMALLRLL